MYIVIKRMEISSCHFLKLPYESKCSNIHGHNWIVEIEITAKEVDDSGMVFDFTHIQKEVMSLDHKNLNDLMPCNPTAENIAKYLWTAITKTILTNYKAGKLHMSTRVSKVTIQESEGNTACYIP